MIGFVRLPDGSVEARSEVVVGLERRDVRVPIEPAPDVIDPGGLGNMPVVVLMDVALEPVARAGAERAGRARVGLLPSAGAATLGSDLLRLGGVAEVLLIVAGVAEAGQTLVTVRALGGRPLPALPLDDLSLARSMLRACWVDLDVALPSHDDADRAAARLAAEELRLFETHHVVEVDPRPALGSAPHLTHGLDATMAGAAGVLAGRIAAGNRRWR